MRPHISGYVLDSISNKAIPNVIVKYSGESREEKTKTDDSGKYTFTMIKEGYNVISLEGRSREYLLEFSKLGYSNYKLVDGTRHGFTTGTKKVDTIKLKSTH
ncbi:carboxypeptidase-like regulatory domain-containing protein [Chryseobacterium polytrichastri]|nr:carboxypeptidase-like regulatory domain-containing protein [Chryseobacterium polytrichastri]